jgi:RNA polymerase sigma-70 factor (ECF subfamily)
MYLVREESASTGYVLDQLEPVYSFIYARVGNRPDAEDLTQQVALKALPRLREDAALEEIRAYLFATARSVLATFWTTRFRLPESELAENVADDSKGSAPAPSAESADWLERTLSALPQHYRCVLELRFLRGCSVREAAREMGKTEGAIKVMQLRALRAAAQTTMRPSPIRPARRPLASAPGFAFGPPPATPTA